MDNIKQMSYEQLQKEANQCMENILFLAIDKKQPPNVKSEEYQNCCKIVTEFRKQFLDNMAQTLKLDDKAVESIKAQLNSKR